MLTYSLLGTDTVYVSRDGTRIARADKGVVMYGTQTVNYMPLNGYSIRKRDGAINLPKSAFPEIKRLLGVVS